MRDHKKLRVFEIADQLVLAVYRETQTFPDDERFGLTSQLRRSALSVASNIVEGCARPSQGDYLRFLNIAYGSMCELQYQLSVAARLGILTKETHRALEEAASHTSRSLNRLIHALAWQPSRWRKPEVGSRKPNSAARAPVNAFTRRATSTTFLLPC